MCYKHPFLRSLSAKPRLSILTMNHFQVQYQSDHFLDKNKDYVVPEHQDLLGVSKCPFVAGLFPPIAEESSKSSKFSSIGSRFKVKALIISSLMKFSFKCALKREKGDIIQFLTYLMVSSLSPKTRLFHDLVMQLQLQSLMETLNATEPHYIRCVKPNNLLKPAIFENQNILQQLRCGVSYFNLCIYY